MPFTPNFNLDFSSQAYGSGGLSAADSDPTPKAYLIADFSADPDDLEKFVIEDEYTKVVDKYKRDRDFSNLTWAEKTIAAYVNFWNVDPIGAEDYASGTPFKTEMEGVFGSLHYMVLGARGGQRFHFHPPARDSKGKFDLETSRRNVILYPLINKTSGESGVKFEWFDADVSIEYNESTGFTQAVGTPITNKYQLELKAGQIALVSFGKGIHKFGGQALAISAHFKDRVADGASAKDAYLDNTSGWQGPEPETIIDVEPQYNFDPRTAVHNVKDSLRQIFFDHTITSREFLEKLSGKPLSVEDRKRFVQALMVQLSSPSVAPPS